MLNILKFHVIVLSSWSWNRKTGLNVTGLSACCVLQIMLLSGLFASNTRIMLQWIINIASSMLSLHNFIMRFWGYNIRENIKILTFKCRWKKSRLHISSIFHTFLFHEMIKICSFLICNFPMNPHVRLLVVWLLPGPVFHNFNKRARNYTSTLLSEHLFPFKLLRKSLCCFIKLYESIFFHVKTTGTGVVRNSISKGCKKSSIFQLHTYVH